MRDCRSRPGVVGRVFWKLFGVGASGRIHPLLPDDEGAVDPGPAKEEMTPDRFHEVTFLSFSYKGTPRSCCVCAS